MITKKQLAITLIASISASLAVWFALHSNTTVTQENKPDKPHVFMTDVREMKMDETGYTKTVLITPKAINTPQSNTTVVDQPHFISYDHGKPIWQIQAKHGKALNGTKKVILWDQVKMKEFPGPKSHHMTLTTSEMTIYPDKNYAETDKPVTITQPGSIIHAIGMQADIKNSIVKLLSEVKGTHKTEKMYADTATINFKTKQDSYTGNVQAINDKSILKGDAVSTERNKSNKIISIVNSGQPALYETIEHDKQNSPIKALADTIKTYPIKNLATLIKNAQLKNGSHALNGDLINIQRNANKKITSITDQGNPAHYHGINKSDKDSIDASSQFINVLPLQNQAVFNQQVHLSNGNAALSGDKITIARNKAKKITAILDQGNPAKYQTTPEQSEKSLTALAQTINIFPQKNQAMLINNANVTNGNTTLRGDQITIQRNTKNTITSIVNIGSPALYHATDGTNQKPLDAIAKNITIFPQKNTALLSEQVKITQDRTILTADTVTIERDKDKKIERVIAQGNPVHYHTINESDQKPVDAIAKTITLFPKKNQVILISSVQLSNDRSTLMGDKITIERDNNKQIKSIVAEGTPAHYHAIPEPNQPPFDATAKIITYKPSEHLALLEKDAFARQGAETMRGSLIKYDILRATVESTKTQNNQTHITIDNDGIARLNALQK